MTTNTGWVEARLMSVDVGLESLRRDLLADIERLAAELARAAAALRAGDSLDSLGVVRGRGLDIDRKCAVLAHATRDREAWATFAARAAKGA